MIFSSSLTALVKCAVQIPFEADLSMIKNASFNTDSPEYVSIQEDPDLSSFEFETTDNEISVIEGNQSNSRNFIDMPYDLNLTDAEAEDELNADNSLSSIKFEEDSEGPDYISIPSGDYEFSDDKMNQTDGSNMIFTDTREDSFENTIERLRNSSDIYPDDVSLYTLDLSESAE